MWMEMSLLTRAGTANFTPLSLTWNVSSVNGNFCGFYLKLKQIKFSIRLKLHEFHHIISMLFVYLKL